MFCKIYIAGPMSGMPEHNFPAFNAAARRLRSLGLEVVNPAELDAGDTTQRWTYYMRRDLRLLVECDAVALLPGWDKSRGANLEVHVATALGMGLYRYHEERSGITGVLEPVRENILTEADRLTGGDRQRDYGHPLDDFNKTALMWSAIFGVPVTAEQVGLAMVCVKVSRHLNRPKRDNLVDLAGYARTVEMVEEERARRQASRALETQSVQQEVKAA